jgi:hypothetical protein
MMTQVTDQSQPDHAKAARAPRIPGRIFHNLCMWEARRRTQTQSLLLAPRLVRLMIGSCGYESYIILEIPTTLLLFLRLSACYGYWRLRSGLLGFEVTTGPAL